MRNSPPFFPIGDCDDECNGPLYIRGPRGFPGGIGPTGMTGPVGPSGAAGLQETVTESSLIPVGQVYTIVDAPGVTTQTLPPISSVLVDGLANPYTIYNYSGHTVGVLGSDDDLVQRAAEAFEKFENESVTFLPTLLGWLVI